jgi:hypothetical protein
MSFHTQSQYARRATVWLLRKLFSELGMILAILFGSILFMALTNDAKTKAFLATQAKAEYCDGAPECYSLDANGNETLEFGSWLNSQIGTKPFQQSWNLLDIDKLAHAVQKAETGGCTKGVAITHNNPTGIRRNGKFVRYSSCEEGLEDFKYVWLRFYKRFPTMQDAIRWTGNDSPSTWLATVTSSYYND